MKKVILPLMAFLAFVMTGFSMPGKQATPGVEPETKAFGIAGAQDFNMDDFLNLTPSEYKKITGKKMGFKNALALKMLQKKIKHNKGKAPEDLDKSVYIALAILIPFVAVGIASDWQGAPWIIALLLSCIFWIPGIIYALIKMKDYYG